MSLHPYVPPPPPMSLPPYVSTPPCLSPFGTLSTLGSGAGARSTGARSNTAGLLRVLGAFFSARDVAFSYTLQMSRVARAAVSIPVHWSAYLAPTNKAFVTSAHEQWTFLMRHGDPIGFWVWG